MDLAGLGSFFVAFPLLAPYCLASLPSSVFYCFSLLALHPVATAFALRRAVSLLASSPSSLEASSLLLIARLCSFPAHSLQALKEELSARQDSLNSLQHQHREQEEKCRKLQRRLEQLEEEGKASSSQQQHLQSLVEALRR